MTKISVSIITFNHEKFIEKALDSVLSQVVNTEIEIIICDDCSTDNTVSLINNYLIKVPDKIKFLQNDLCLLRPPRIPRF
jgi:glycosyltransferase involved in cell wall biosynthesis